jgi:hypothetical protein
MADTVPRTAAGSIDAHPDFPEFFRQAQEAVWGEFAPRVEQALAAGNNGAVERLTAEVERQARQRAVVAARAMLNFQEGRGGPGLNRAFSRGTPTLSGAENQPPTMPPSGPPVPAPRMPGVEDLRRLDTSAPLSPPTPGSLMAQPGIGARAETTYPDALPSTGQRVRALGAGLVTPFGIGTGPPVEDVAPVPTLSGAEVTPSLVQGVDLGAAAAEDPAGAEIGRMVGFGPAFRAAGAAGESLLEGARGIGGLLARTPRATALGAGATALTAGASEAEPPDVATQIATLQASQKRLNDENAALGMVPDPQDPQKRITFQQRFGNVGPNSAPEEIRALQEFLASPQGYSLYSVDQNGRPVRPDGRWFARQGQVSGTQLALQAYLERLRTERATRETGLSRIAGQLGPLQEQSRRLEANATTAASEANMPYWQRAVRDYVPAVAGLAGGFVGGLWRRGIRNSGDEASRITSAEADSLLAGAGTAPVGARVGAINQYYTRGGGEAPFSLAPGAQAGFAPSGAPQGAMGLYPPSSPWMRQQDWGRTAGFGVGGALGGARYLGIDREAVKEAQDRYDANPTRANADALRTAQYKAAASQSAMTAGLGAAFAYPAAAAAMRYRSPRPNLGAAEEEVMSLNALARGQNNQLPPMRTRQLDRNFSLPRTAPVATGETETFVSPAGENMIYRDPRTGDWMRTINGGPPRRFPQGPPRTYRRIAFSGGGEGSDGGSDVG